MPPASTILMIFMNNPKSITQCKAGGCDAQHGDPRFVALKATALELQRRGHRVLIDVAGGLSIRPDQAREQLLGFEWIDDRSVTKYGKPAIAIAWFAYFADKGTKRSPIVQKLLNDATVPRLWYENGMTKASVTVDPKGFLGDSYYVSSLNSRVQRPPFDEAKCEAHIREHLESDSSKRPQSRVVDIPASIVRRYIFIPTQKFDDLSVRQYSAISYLSAIPSCLIERSTFAARRTCRWSSRSIRIYAARRAQSNCGASGGSARATRKSMSRGPRSTS